jgi:hypothetical protein
MCSVGSSTSSGGVHCGDGGLRYGSISGQTVPKGVNDWVTTISTECSSPTLGKMAFVSDIGAKGTVLVPLTINGPQENNAALNNNVSDGLFYSIDLDTHGANPQSRLLGSTGPARALAAVGNQNTTIGAGQFVGSIDKVSSVAPVGFTASPNPFTVQPMSAKPCGHSSVQALSAIPGVDLDVDLGLIVAGTYTLGGSLAGKPLLKPMSPTAENIFVVRNGNPKNWAGGLVATKGPNVAEVADVAVVDKDVFVAGTFSGELSCTYGAPVTISAGASTAGFVAHLDLAEGTCKKLVAITATGALSIHGMTWKPSDHKLVLVGDFQGTLPVPLQFDAMGTDGFVMLLDANLAPVSGFPLGGGGDQSARGLVFATTTNGKSPLFVVGDFDHELVLPNSTYNPTGVSDAYVVKLDLMSAQPSPVLVWQSGGKGEERGTSIVLGSNTSDMLSRLLVGGTFTGDMELAQMLTAPTGNSAAYFAHLVVP